MTNRHILIFGVTLAVLLLSACLPTQLPLRPPPIAPPSVPSLTVPTLSVPAIPTIAIPAVGMPTVNAPAIALTMVKGALGTSAAPPGTPVPAIPVTGGASPNAAKWFLFGVAAVIGVAIVIMVFARFIRRTDYPNEIDGPTDRRDE